MHQDSPAVSVCIANYNGIGLLDDCIASLDSQVTDFSIEIIVHDDASTDGSATYIRTRFPSARLIESEDNVGFCVANNRMAAVARGEWLLLLNNDAALMPGALMVLMAEALRLGGPAILTLPQFSAETGDLLDIGSRLDPFLNPVPNLNPDRNDVGTVHGACLWIPKALWTELGGFPEWFDSVGEDLYLCCRARLAGYPVRALGKSGYRHRVGASFGGGKVCNSKLSTTFRRRALSERNKTFVMAMTYPLPFIVILLPLHLVLLLMEGLLLSVLKICPTYLYRIYLPVFGALLHRRNVLLAGRRATLAMRRISVSAFFAPVDLLPHKLRMLLRHGLPEAK